MLVRSASCRVDRYLTSLPLVQVSLMVSLFAYSYCFADAVLVFSYHS